MPTQACSPPLPALLLQVGIEGLEALKARDGNEKVPPDIAHQVLDLPLVIRLAQTAKTFFEQVVGLQLTKGPGALTLPIVQNARHRKLGVVVENAVGDTADEGEGRVMTGAEGFGPLRRIGWS